MASEYMFAVGTIGRSTRNGRKPSTLLGAASHNRRAIQAELGARGHIDPQRVSLNETIHGPDNASGVVALAMSMMVDAGVDVHSLRKDYTQAIELLFSLPVDAAIDDGKFFRRCVAWTGERMGLGNVLSADIHRDESTPHCHVLVLPLVNGKMQGSSLIDRTSTAALRESFYRDVAKPFGLKRPVDRMKGVDRVDAGRAVLAAIESRQDAILRSVLWVTVKRDIEHNPSPYVDALGIELLPTKQKRMRTVAQIFTSPGRGPKTERVRGAKAFTSTGKPIGFDATDSKPIGFANHPDRDRNLSCVGFAQSSPHLSHQSDPVEDARVVDRDGCDFPPDTSSELADVDANALRVNHPDGSTAHNDAGAVSGAGSYVGMRSPIKTRQRPNSRAGAAYVSRDDVEPLPPDW